MRISGQFSFIFFMKDILKKSKKCQKDKQKHLSNIQPDIFKQKKNHKQKYLSNIQPDISKQKKHKQKHLSNFKQIFLNKKST